MTIYEYSLSECMLKSNTRPFFMMSSSNAGKSVIAIDFFVKAALDKVYNDFLYITGTYAG